MDCLLYFCLGREAWFQQAGQVWYLAFIVTVDGVSSAQTVVFFIKDQIKKFILSCVLNVAIMSGLLSIIKWGGEYFYIYAWLFVLVISLVSTISSSL